jgi:hypothetical protein
MQLSRDGAEHLPAALTPADLAALEQVLAPAGANRPGVRLHGDASLSKCLSTPGVIGRLAARRLGPGARPVRAILFNKTADQNWSLAWHQDRTIAVAARIDVPGFTHWTVKSGVHHVEPPFDLLERMLTLRVHLDAVGPANAPLLIAHGSHRRGRIEEAQIPSIVAKLGTQACLAAAGDIWLYAAPILHASEPAAAPRSRRVLQVDFAAEDLPPPLEWLGV